MKTGNLFGKMLAWVPASSICQMCRPVRVAARFGEHWGAAVKAFENRHPSAAIRSIPCTLGWAVILYLAPIILRWGATNLPGGARIAMLLIVGVFIFIAGG